MLNLTRIKTFLANPLGVREAVQLRHVTNSAAATLSLLVAACGPAPSSPVDEGQNDRSATGVETKAAATAVPADKSVSATVTTNPTNDQSATISEDRDGVAADTLAIVKKIGAPSAGCEIHLSYKKVGARVARWEAAPCDEVDAEILTQAQLIEMGQWDDLPIDAVSDIKRYNKGGFLWVEAGPAASIFILDGVMRLREVSVAD